MRLGKRIVDGSCSRASLVLRHQALALPESERHHHPVELKTETGDREGTKNNSKVCLWGKDKACGWVGEGGQYSLSQCHAWIKICEYLHMQEVSSGETSMVMRFTRRNQGDRPLAGVWKDSRLEEAQIQYSRILFTVVLSCLQYNIIIIL